MAKIKIKITEDKATLISKVVVTGIDVPMDNIVNSLKEQFELEMMVAKIEIEDDNDFTISFETPNQEKIKILRKAIADYYFQAQNGNQQN